MSYDEYRNPGSPGAAIQWKDLDGALLLIEPKVLEEDIPTQHSKPGVPSPAVRADVYVLDGSQAGEEYLDTLIFPKILQSQTRTRIGSKVLGRLGQGRAKGSQSPPWVLADFTDADRKTAKDWQDKQGKNAFASPGKSDDPPPF